jgi:hypothetical protein
MKQTSQHDRGELLQQPASSSGKLSITSFPSRCPPELIEGDGRVAGAVMGAVELLWLARFVGRGLRDFLDLGVGDKKRQKAWNETFTPTTVM